MNTIKKFLMLAAVCAGLAACGGGENTITAPPSTGTPTNNVTKIDILTSSPSVDSDGVDTVTLTAYALNASNQYVPDTLIQFSADSGALAITNASTTADAGATATLSSGSNPTSRTITVTATVGAVTATVPVTVSGTRLTIDGPDAVGISQTGNYTITLTNSSGVPLANRSVELTSAQSNTLTPATVTTNAGGTAAFTMTGANPGNDTLTARALGESVSKAVTVSGDSFVFVSPAVNAEVAINTAQPVTVRWTISGAPQVGQVINFATTRGAIAATATTNGSGEATVNVSSISAGGAVISANSTTGSATLPVEFVSTTAVTLDLQPSLFTIGTGDTSTLTATVRDAAGNLVKNKTVTFSLQDVTGGTLSTPTAVTNSQGIAKSVYTAGTVTSATNGVVVTATVQGTPTATDNVAMTVAGRQVFISLGTGNEIEEFTTAQYRLEYAVQITDATGNGVPNVPVSVSVKSYQYRKGIREFDSVLETWGYEFAPPICDDEDADGDGSLDLVNGVVGTGEDFNGNGFLEAGNIATVTPSSVTTDANGFATIFVVYPQEYAYWLTVNLTARTSVQGTEYARTARFLLPGSEQDFGSEDVSPPGPVSPFGSANSCSNPN